MGAAAAPTCLVTGGTGFLGAHLVRRLLLDGVGVRVLVRSHSRAKPLRELGAQVVVGDITDKRAVQTAMEGVSVIYHLAGKLLIPGVPASEYRRTHVEGTRTVLDCCLEQPGLERLVHCSTTGVLGATGDRAQDESAPFSPRNAYEATKAEAELLVRATAGIGSPSRQQNLRAVIVRPGLVYGPGDLHLLGFFRSIQRGYFRPIGRKPVWLHPIYIDDMIEALVCCGHHPRAVGECFHIAGQEPVTMGDLTSAIAQALGVLPAPGWIPLSVAQIAAVAGDVLPVRLRAAAPLTRSRLDFLTNSRMYDVTKARDLLGFVASTDLATGLAQTVAWYRQHGFLADARPPALTRNRGRGAIDARS